MVYAVNILNAKRGGSRRIVGRCMNFVEDFMLQSLQNLATKMELLLYQLG
jgi:hypothetical protein